MTLRDSHPSAPLLPREPADARPAREAPPYVPNLAEAYAGALRPRIADLIDGQFDTALLRFLVSDLGELLVEYRDYATPVRVAHFDDADHGELDRPDILDEMADLVCHGLLEKGELFSLPDGDGYLTSETFDEAGGYDLHPEDVADWAYDDRFEG